MNCENCGAALTLTGLNPDARIVQVMCRSGHKAEYRIMDSWMPWVAEIAIKVDNLSMALGAIPNPMKSMITTQVYELAGLAVLAARVRPEEPAAPVKTEGQLRIKLKVYTDGSCHPNPGPGGCGFIIKDDEGTVVARESIPATADVSNNVAEYMGVREALDHITRELMKYPGEIEIYSDSELMVKQLRDEYAVGKALAGEHKAVMARIEDFARAGTKVTIEWIPGETNPAHELAEAAYHEAKRLRGKK